METSTSSGSASFREEPKRYSPATPNARSCGSTALSDEMTSAVCVCISLSQLNEDRQKRKLDTPGDRCG